MNLEQFIRSGLQRAWIAPHPDMSAYVRRSTRFDKGRMVKCIDIASVGVDEKRQKQGIFTKFLESFEKTAFEIGVEAVFVESIMNNDLYRFLIKRGYSVARGSGCDLIYYVSVADSKAAAA